MVFGKAQPRRAAALLVAAGLASTGFLAASPAKAQEDTNAFNSMLGFFGMQFDKEDERIDYHARAPIVVPPKMDLPKPKEASRGQDWPTDPDVAERRRAALDSRRLAPQPTPNTRAELSQAELQRGVGGNHSLPTEGPPSECQASAGTPICLYAPWKALQNAFAGAQPDAVQPGVEPDRKYLTEPPPGYRKASATAKATIEVPKDQTDPGDAAGYIRDQQRHKVSVDN